MKLRLLFVLGLVLTLSFLIAPVPVTAEEIQNPGTKLELLCMDVLGSTLPGQSPVIERYIHILETNIGNVPLYFTRVQLICYPDIYRTFIINYAPKSGDILNKGVLDPGETWVWEVNRRLLPSDTVTIVGNGFAEARLKVYYSNGYVGRKIVYVCYPQFPLERYILSLPN